MQRNRYSNIDELAHGFAEYAAEILSAALKAHHHASLVVPGGNTPRYYLPVLAAKSLPWNRITITLSDERWVNAESADSNEHLVKQCFLDHMPQEPDFIGLKTGHDRADEAIAEIDQRLEKIPRPFTLTVLGLGEDGHIASLFPGLKLHETAHGIPGGQYCLAVNPPVAPSPRVSLSLKALACSEQIVLVVTGHRKRKLLNRLAENLDPAIPLVWLLQSSDSPIMVFETD